MTKIQDLKHLQIKRCLLFDKRDIAVRRKIMNKKRADEIMASQWVKSKYQSKSHSNTT